MDGVDLSRLEPGAVDGAFKMGDVLHRFRFPAAYFPIPGPEMRRSEVVKFFTPLAPPVSPHRSLDPRTIQIDPGTIPPISSPGRRKRAGRTTFDAARERRPGHRGIPSAPARRTPGLG